MNMSVKCVLKSLGNVKILRPSIGVDGGAICRSQVVINFNPKSFSRRTSLDVEKQIDDIWKAKCEKNSRLYNASKFRLGGWQILDEKYVLNIGLTSYKELCGSNLAPNYDDLQDKGRTHFGDPQAYMSDTIGVGILLLTSDGCVVVTRRAPWTGEYPGMLDRPGGHPEPDKILTPDGTLKAELMNKFDIQQAVMDEIWDSAAQEAEDEIGITKDKLIDMKFLGLSLSVETGDKPSLEFFARLNLKSEQVREIYDDGRQKEFDESTSLHLIPSPISSLLPQILLRNHHLHEVEINEDIKEDDTDSALLSKSPDSGGKEAKGGSSTDDLDLSSSIREATLLLEEATPALKAGLMLAHAYQLL